MADETVPTAVDDLVDGFVQSLLPTHHRLAAVPYATIEVRKTDLRAAAYVFLTRYADYLHGGDAAPALAETPVPQPRPPAEGGHHAVAD